MKKNIAYSIGAVIILVISFVAFVGFGGISELMSQKNQEKQKVVFGSYDKKEIYVTPYEQNTDFNKNLREVYNNYASQGIQVPAEYQSFIYQQAFSKTVQQFAFESALNKSGYSVPAESINRIMRLQFTDANGNFSNRMYNSMSDSDVAALREEIRDSLYLTRFSADHFGSDDDVIGEDSLYGLKASDDEVAFLASMNNNKRAFTAAVFQKSNFPESEKIKFGKNNAAKFFKYDMLAITLEDENKAKQTANDIASEKTTFEDAIVYSTKYYTDTEGNLTNAYQYQLENTLEDKADLAKITDLAVGGVSPVLKTGTGYTIFKMVSDPVAPDFDDEEIKSRVSTYINSYETSVIEDYYVAIAKNFAAAAAKDFDAACEATEECEKVEIPAFPLNYGGVEVADSIDTTLTGFAGADSNENFLKTAFTLKENEISEPMVVGNNIVVIKYTGSEEAEESKSDEEITDSILKFDQEAAYSAIMNSDKLKDNFATTYYRNFSNY
ncbi:MAG: hypothetical protein MJ162_02400 [Treponema sp.]|nr:hypothetical protein [Treponema sp.]